MRIAEVSKKYDITADTLRYYEKVGLLPNVRKTEGGIRDYSEDDCKWVQFIKCMRGAGLPIEVLAKYITLFYIGDETLQERKEILIEQRNLMSEKITNMQDTLDKLNFKIEKYETLVAEKEKELKNGNLIFGR